MKIGILCAGDDELAPFLPEIEGCTIQEKAMLKFYEGKLAGVQIVALYSGVCKVNAAIAAQILIETFHVDAVINSGTAGAISPELDILDTVISTKAAYHDVEPTILTEFHPWMDSEFFHADEKLIELSKAAVRRLGLPHRVVWGTMVTGEAFIEDSGRQAIRDRYAPLSVDMETAAIAHVCFAYSIPFLAIRSITDTAAHSGQENFENNCLNASKIAKDISVALLGELRKTADIDF